MRDAWDTTKRVSKGRTNLILSRTRGACQYLEEKKLLVASHFEENLHEKRPACLPRTLAQNACKLDDKFAVAHDDPAIYLDGAAAWNDIHVDFGIPISARKLGIRIAKRNMQAWHLLVL